MLKFAKSTERINSRFGKLFDSSEDDSGHAEPISIS